MIPRFAAVSLLLIALLPSVALSAVPLPDYPFIRIAAEMHTARIQAIASDAEGRYLATASYDKTVKLWDAPTGKLLKTFWTPTGPGIEGSLNSVALSPDGRTLAAGGFTGSSWDGSYSVYLFDAGTGEMLSRITGFKRQIGRLAYSRDGRRLAVTVFSGKGLYVFDTADNRKVFSDEKYRGNIQAVGFSGNGLLAAASDSGEIRLYNPDGSTVFSQASDRLKGIWSMAFSPDGKKLVLGYEWDSRREVDIINASDGSWERTLQGVQGALQSTAWSLDGNYIYAAGARQNQSGHKLLHIWSVSSGRLDEVVVLPPKTAVKNLLPLKGGSLAFSAPFTGFGVFTGKNLTHRAASLNRPGRKEQFTEAEGGVAFFNRLAVPDFQKNHDSFRISSDASSIMFSYEHYGQAKALFDLRKRKIITSGIPEADLLKPRTTGNNIDVQSWDTNTTKPPKFNGSILEGFSADGTEYSSCLAVRPDEKGFVIGTSHFLRSYDSKGKLLWSRRIPYRAWDVNISADSGIIVASFDDGTIRWFSMPDGKELYSLYLHPDRKRWVLWLNDGYFDHGPDSEKLIGFVVNRTPEKSAEIVRIDRMYDLFYRPDILEKAVNGQDISVHLKHLKKIGSEMTGTAALKESERVQAGQQKPGTGGLDAETKHATPEEIRKPDLKKDPAVSPEVAEVESPAAEQAAVRTGSLLDTLVNRNSLPPLVRFMTPSGISASSDVRLLAELCDNGGGIGDITIYINNMPVLVEGAGRGLKQVSKESAHKCHTFEHVITLKQDVNDIALMAFNRANTIESKRDRISLTLPAPAPVRPRLHIMTVAVNRYRDGDLRLKYAIDDADELIRVVSVKAKELFADVLIHRLHDGDVTKKRLEERFAEIGTGMTREDVFILFLAGHGVSDERDGLYYFLPADFRYTDQDAVSRNGISMNDFKRYLAGIRAMKSLILLDTCSSGAFAESMASRGVTEKTAINKLARTMGRATIAASSKSQVALEGYEGHGVFSYTVLEGMKGKAAGPEGQITISRLATFIEETLPELTFKKWGYEQIPQKTLTGSDFQIGTK